MTKGSEATNLPLDAEVEFRGGIVEWTRTRKYGRDRDRESILRKRIC